MIKLTVHIKMGTKITSIHNTDHQVKTLQYVYEGRWEGFS